MVEQISQAKLRSSPYRNLYPSTGIVLGDGTLTSLTMAASEFCRVVNLPSLDDDSISPNGIILVHMVLWLTQRFANSNFPSEIILSIDFRTFS